MKTVLIDFDETAWSYLIPLAPSDAQWNKLLNIVSDDTEMRTGQYTDGAQGKARLGRKWLEAAKEINAEGPEKKNGNQWKDVSRVHSTQL